MYWLKTLYRILQPKSASTSGQSTEEIIEKTTKDILAKIPHEMDLKAVMLKYPLMYEESMNTVLSQEIMRYVGVDSDPYISAQLSLNSITVEDRSNVIFSNEKAEDSSILWFPVVISFLSESYLDLKKFLYKILKWSFLRLSTVNSQ